MAVLSESVLFPVWAAAALAVAIVVATMLIRRLEARRQIGVVVGIALLAVASIVGPSLLRAIAGLPDRRAAVVTDDAAAERRALDRRRAELGAHATAPGSTLACLDALASKPVQTACERSVFASATSVARAVSYAATQLRLLADGVAFARRSDPSYLASLAELRLAVENDAYGIYAHVLATRDGCTPERCDVFALLHDASKLKVHLRQQPYVRVIAQHRERWEAREPSSAVARLPAGPEPSPSSTVPATSPLATSTSVSIAAGAVPFPRERPIVTARADPAAAASEPGAQSRTPAEVPAAVRPAPSLWVASAAVPIETRTPPADAAPVVDSPAAPAAVEKSLAAAPVAGEKSSAAEPTPVDSPSAAASAREALSRGVVPPVASVLPHLEYPSASSIPPISIMGAEPSLPDQAVPSTTPLPRQRPQ